MAADIPVNAMLTVGVGLTVTTAFAEFVQAPLVPTTVYVIVLPGLAVALAQLVQLKPVLGVHT